MENRCPRCELETQADDKFCGGCGIDLSKAEHMAGKTQVEMKLSDIHLNLGMVYLKKGDYPKAILSFEKILKEEPNNAEAQELLEQAQNAMKGITNAAQH